MRPIVFIDTVCPKPYDNKTLEKDSLGGTEATVVRIAESLGKTRDVVVAQHNRERVDEGNGNILYVPLDFLTQLSKPNIVINLRSPIALPFVKEKFGNVKTVLWLHDLADRQLLIHHQILRDIKPLILGVSKFHKGQITDLLLRNLDEIWKDITVKYIYNPLDDSLKPDKTKTNWNKLVFFSSPHKGLKYTLELFKILYNENPNFKLYVANPGYLDNPFELPKGAYNLGSLSHKDVLRHVRESLCVFYPNTVFPETFGLVFAEANAVGIPVLAHEFGAAAEVLGSPTQVIDARDQKAYITRILDWSKKDRPKVSINENFRLQNVIQNWETICLR